MASIPITPISKNDHFGIKNIHRQNAVIHLPKGEPYFLYFNATVPHAIHITYEGKAVVKTPQNYFGKFLCHS